MKKSFVLYHDQYEAVEDLTVEQKGQLLDAMFLYSRGEEMPKFDPIVKMAFKFFKIVFDRDAEKWEARRGKNKDNGKKGGRPKNKDLVTVTGKIVPKEISEGHFLYLIKDISNGEYKIGETQNLFTRRYDIKRPTNNLEIHDFVIMKDRECRKSENDILNEYSDFSIGGDWFNMGITQVNEILVKYFQINPNGYQETQGNRTVSKKPVSGSGSLSVSSNVSGNGRKDIPSTPPPAPSDPFEKFPVDVVTFVNEFQDYIEKETGFKATKTILKNCCDTVDKLIRIDKHTLMSIREAMRWATTDDFWSGQVKSLAGLRKSGKNEMKKFENLLTAMNRPQGGISSQSTTLEHNRMVGKEWLNE